MIYIFLLSLNILLILIYSIFIRLKISRLSLIFLLLPLCIPFIGELCMLACEFGLIKFERSEEETSVYTKKKDPFNVKVGEYTRETLLEVIKKEPDNLIEILNHALHSEDSEVVHVAASSLMKIKNKYDKKVKTVSERYERLPNNKDYKNDYIQILDEYINSGLLFGEIKDIYIKKREVLEK